MQPTGNLRSLLSVRLPLLSQRPTSATKIGAAPDGAAAAQIPSNAAAQIPSNAEHDPEVSRAASTSSAGKTAQAEVEGGAEAATAAAAAEIEGDILHIRISENGCCLASPLPPSLVGRCEDLVETERPAEILLEELRSRGLNLMPKDRDMAAALRDEEWHPPLMSRAVAAPKIGCLEDRVWRDVSRVCSAFALHSCRYQVKQRMPTRGGEGGGAIYNNRQATWRYVDIVLDTIQFYSRFSCMGQQRILLTCIGLPTKCARMFSDLITFLANHAEYGPA